MTLRHGSLFSGIGGFDLAAEWCGWKNVFHCEWNEFGQKVLKHYWPEAESYGDITKTDFTKWRGTVDVISGGFPCQPYSSAGKRLGKEDERHLWPEMLRAIREAAPSFVVGENVRGLTNWNGGLVFDEVQTDLENLGYQVAAFLIPAAGVNAPHGRDRVWIVAHNASNSNSSGQQTLNNKKRFMGKQSRTKALGGNSPKPVYTKQGWDNFPTQSPICGGDDGLPFELDGITFSKWRAESIKAYGNAIVPQVAYQIFKSIQQTIK